MQAAVFSMPLKSAGELRQASRKALWTGFFCGIFSQVAYWGAVHFSGALVSGHAGLLQLLTVWSALLFGAWALFGYGQAGGGDTEYLAGRAEAELAQLVEAQPGLQRFHDQVVAARRPFTEGEFHAMRRWAEQQRLYAVTA